MALTLKRSSLVAQVADAVRGEILAKTWAEWLPSEREISSTLHVSRGTCSQAIHALRQEGLVETVVGCGMRIRHRPIGRAHPAGGKLRSVGVISPTPVNLLRPRDSLFIDGLREELFDLGVRLDLHNSPVYYVSNPDGPLAKLLRKNRHDCWLLMRATESIQRWFMERGIPSLVAGSSFPGIDLPSVGDDHGSICRHAANRLIALGHRRIAFLNRRPSGATDRESDAGFAEAVQASPARVEARTVYHESSHKNAVQLIERLFAASAPPTGLLIVNSYCYLSVLSALARLGLRVPEDVSLISKDDDAFLAYLDPEPTRYANAPATLVHKSMIFLRSMLEGAIIRPISVRLIPYFIAGASCRAVGTAPSRANGIGHKIAVTGGGPAP